MDAITIYDVKKRVVEQLSQLVPAEVDDHPQKTGVLLSDEITHLVKHHNLIRGFDRDLKIVDRFNDDNLKPAAYELTVDGEFYSGGKYYNSERDGLTHVVIPPFQVVVLKTAEVICLPRFIIARWNLRVAWAYKGLLWVGASQVDPGYVGNLFCPIYNLSDRPVRIPIGAPFSAIDFVKTTTFDSADCKVYDPPSKRKRIVLQDYEAEDLNSALFTEAGQKITRFENEIGLMESRISTFTTIVVASLAILFGVVAAGGVLGRELLFSALNWAPFVVGISVFTLTLSIMNYSSVRIHRVLLNSSSYELDGFLRQVSAKFYKYWYITLITSLLVAFLSMYITWDVADGGESVLLRDSIEKLNDIEKRILDIEERL